MKVVVLPVCWIANGGQVPMIEEMCHCVALPNLALPPSARYAREGRQKPQLMTVGLMGYEPNYRGVDWFLENCWPVINERFPGMTYVIAGGGLPSALKEMWLSLRNVKVLGYVEDLDTVYSESLAAVTPICSGAGTCIKVVKAALHGRIVFATDFAVRGISPELQSRLGIVKIGNDDAGLEILRKLVDGMNLKDSQDAISRVAEELNSFEKFAEKVGYVVQK